MKVVLSPAKALDENRQLKVDKFTIPYFINEADFLVEKLQKLSRMELGKLMKLSENLTDLNYFRYKNWEKPTDFNSIVRPAIAQFDGAAFKGFDVTSLTPATLENAQNQLRVLSGLYGILKPLDLLYPYRLEMGTKWKVDSENKNLYAFWKAKVTAYLKSELLPNEVLINLASSEYFKVVDQKQLKRRIITPVFKEFKNDKYKVVMMYAKTARGKMARAIIDQKYDSFEKLKAYNIDGYSYNALLSSDNEWVFIR